MPSILFNDSEITYLLLALKQYEASMLQADDDSLEDSVTDLLMVQALRKKLQEIGKASPTERAA